MAESAAYAMAGGGRLEVVADDGRAVLLLDGRPVSKPIDEQYLRVRVTIDLPDGRGAVQLKRLPDGRLSVVHDGRELRRAGGASKGVRNRRRSPEPAPVTPEAIAPAEGGSAAAVSDDAVMNGAYWLAWCVLGNVVGALGYDQLLAGADLPDGAVDFVAYELLLVGALLGLCGLWAALSHRTAWIPLAVAVVALVADTMLLFAISPFLGIRAAAWRAPALYFVVVATSRSFSLDETGTSAQPT